MKFELETVENTAQTLRDLEPQAPKPLKAVMIKASQELQEWQELAKFVSDQLEFVSTLKIGAMDTQSRASDIAFQITRTVANCAARLRSKLA